MSHRDHRKDGENFKKKPKSKPLTPNWNQIPIPDFDFLNSSADDSGDDSSEDEDPDDGVGKSVKNTISSLDNAGDIHLNPLADKGGDGTRKKLRPSLVFAKSASSLLIQGAPKPKVAQNPVTYRYRNIPNEIVDTVPHNDGHLLRKNNSRDQSLLNFRMENILLNLKQNGATPLDGSENQNDYENVVIIGGETTNKVTVCFAWIVIVFFMMEAGFREIKRRIRSLKMRQFLE